MSKVLRSGPRPGDFILSEEPHQFSRDNLTLKSGNVVKPGQVCGIITATGQVVPLNTAASDGSDVAAVLPIYGYDATEAAVMGAFVTRQSQLKEDGLIWPAGISGADKKSAIAELAAHGIIVRPRSYVG